MRQLFSFIDKYLSGRFETYKEIVIFAERIKYII